MHRCNSHWMHGQRLWTSSPSSSFSSFPAPRASWPVGGGGVARPPKVGASGPCTTVVQEPHARPGRPNSPPTLPPAAVTPWKVVPASTLPSPPRRLARSSPPLSATSRAGRYSSCYTHQGRIRMGLTLGSLRRGCGHPRLRSRVRSVGVPISDESTITVRWGKASAPLTHTPSLYGAHPPRQRLACLCQDRSGDWARWPPFRFHNFHTVSATEERTWPSVI